MAYQPVDIGAAPNDGTGDPIRDAFDKVNDNFVELYAGLAGLLDFKGSQDCSANPNYPAASKGDFYLVSVAGKIGGASGVVVSAGDTYFATADNAGGDQASVGTSWTVIQGNVAFTPVNIAGDTMTGDLIVPADPYDATSWNGNNAVPTKDAVRDKIESLGGGSFTAASTTEILTGTDSAKGGTPDSIAALWEQGSDVASAATVSLGEGGYFNITGTTTITDIDFATDKAGRKAWVKFAGALTLTHNASTLILPTGANITTAAGDTACFVSEGTDAVRCVAYSRSSGAALAGGGSTAWTSLLDHDFAATPQSTASVSVAGYNEVLIEVVDAVHAASITRAIQVSTDSGSTWRGTGSNDYSEFGASGATAANAAFFLHATSATAARSCVAIIRHVSDTLTPKMATLYNRGVAARFDASSSAITDIRLMGSSGGSGTPSGSNFTSGYFRVWGR